MELVRHFVALSLLAVSLARSDSSASARLQGLCVCECVCVLVFILGFFIFTYFFQFGLKTLLTLDPSFAWFVLEVKPTHALFTFLVFLLIIVHFSPPGVFEKMLLCHCIIWNSQNVAVLSVFEASSYWFCAYLKTQLQK